MSDKNKYARTLTLKDGRTLGYAEIGSSNGKPVFYFNGFPASRLEARAGEEDIEKSGIRLISIDRPGIGISDPKPKRTFLDWPDDVLELADALNIEKFAVIGISGGGPYSLACAYKIPPNRLVAAATCGGMGPIEAGLEGMKKSNVKLFTIAKKMPWILRFLFWVGFTRKVKNADDAHKKLLAGMDDFPEADQKLFKDPKLGRLFAEESFEAFHQGSKWVAHECKLYSRPWGFKLEDISPEIKVFIFHGELDNQVPIGMAKYMANLIPNSEAIYFPNETHFGAALNRIEEMVSKISNLI